MKDNLVQENLYTTKSKPLSFMAQYFPSLHFYTRFIGIVLRSSARAKRGDYDDAAWSDSSHDVLGYLEDIGAQIGISGFENIRDVDGPCVFIGNHMSFLETLLMPAIILPKPVTFVVKQSLLDYPVFKHILISRKPIAVTRSNPRQDLKTVLEEGAKRLKDGISVVVFPQSTRSHTFEPGQMSSIGVKLAKKADVPIVPVAIKTDALQNGALLKDFGKIDRSIPIRFAFDAPLKVNGRGSEEQDGINSFIGKKLEEWGEELTTG